MDESLMRHPLELGEGLWTFPIVLPNNPLKWLNCYVIKGGPGGRNLLIDTGFSRPECREALMAGMAELELRPEETDVFLTHLHSDHVGNAHVLQQMGCRILMGRVDYEQCLLGEEKRWAAGCARARREGMPVHKLDQVCENDRSVIFSSGAFQAKTVENGQRLNYRSYSLECILTPGHTPGHMCLYDRRSRTMFLGDHVLFDITPNICVWSCMEDSLGDYLDSLRLIGRYDIKLALPGHRHLSELSVQERIAQLLAHHEKRLENLLAVVRAYPGLSAYEIAGRMRWSIAADCWDDFPSSQQYFAHSETMSHLAYLCRRGKLIKKTEGEDFPRYFASDAG